MPGPSQQASPGPLQTMVVVSAVTVVVVVVVVVRALELEKKNIKSS